MSIEGEKIGRIWEELNKLRDRQHQLSTHVMECQAVGKELVRLRDQFDEHGRDAMGDKVRFAAVEEKVKTLEEIERGRTGKLIAVVSVVTGVVSLLAQVVAAFFRG